MSTVPFRRFITTFLLFGKDISYIQSKLSAFGYHSMDDSIEAIFKDIKETLPEKYREMVIKKELFDLKDPNQVQWLEHFGVFEFYDYIVRSADKLAEPPDYFKWISDCMWVHGYKDVTCLINIFLFNNESPEEIVKIIEFKYRKIMSANAIILYQKIFWDTLHLTAKEALYYCLPFRDNALIIRNLRGGTEFESASNIANGMGNIENENSDGSDVPFVFHDVNYIKWKIGYRGGIAVPTSRDFLENVRTDSVFKYYEAMNMTRSFEVEEEVGENDKIGTFNSTRVRKRNVEEQKAAMAKKWLDIHIKAQASMPTNSGKTEDFFEKMRQLDMVFDDGTGEERIMHIDDMPGMLDQIKGDMSPM